MVNRPFSGDMLIFAGGHPWAVWSRGNVFETHPLMCACTQKKGFFSFAKWHVKTWWNSVDLFGDDPFAGQMSRCTCSTDLLQLVLKGVVLEMPWRDRISLTVNIATRYDISHPNPKHHWEHGISSMSFLRTKKPSLNHWYYKRLRPPTACGNKQKAQLADLHNLQKGYLSIFPMT